MVELFEGSFQGQHIVLGESEWNQNFISHFNKNHQEFTIFYNSELFSQNMKKCFWYTQIYVLIPVIYLHKCLLTNSFFNICEIQKAHFKFI